MIGELMVVRVSSVVPPLRLRKTSERYEHMSQKRLLDILTRKATSLDFDFRGLLLGNRCTPS